MRTHGIVNVILLLSVTGCGGDPLPVKTAAPQQQSPAAIAPATSEDDPEQLWDVRLNALEGELGKSEEQMLTSAVQLYLGGGADVLTFRQHIDGDVYVTAGLIGDGGQQAADLGQYELMMCSRESSDWMPGLLSRLAPYTFQAALRAGETMDIAPAMPTGSSIAALLFVPYREFTVNESPAAVLLCIGITRAELNHCRVHGHEKLLQALKADGIFPFTDPLRDSVEL